MRATSFLGTFIGHNQAKDILFLLIHPLICRVAIRLRKTTWQMGRKPKLLRKAAPDGEQTALGLFGRFRIMTNTKCKEHHQQTTIPGITMAKITQWTRNLATGLLAGFIAWTTALGAEEELPKVIATKRAFPKEVAPAVQKTLDPTCYSVTLEGKEMLHLWVRANVPTNSTEELPAYNTLEEGTLLGVLELKSEEMTDFRDQKLYPGVFTLRLGVHPQDGNHMGIAAFPEFLCLCAVATDLKPDPVPHDDLMKLSKEAAASGHPLAFFMEPFFEKPKQKFPAVTTNQSSHILMNVQTKATLANKKTADFPIAIIIVGTSDAK